MTTATTFKYPLYVQLTLPENYPGSREAERMFSILRELGADGVELNIADPWTVDLEALVAHLGRFGLSLLNFASGLTAKIRRLSLSDPDEDRRAAAVADCRRMVRLFSGIAHGIILGSV